MFDNEFTPGKICNLQFQTLVKLERHLTVLILVCQEHEVQISAMMGAANGMLCVSANKSFNLGSLHLFCVDMSKLRIWVNI